MERIGLIGGVSWVSTMEYYRRLNMRAQQSGGSHVSADLVVVSLNFEEILARQQANDADGEYDILARAAEVIQHARARKLLICSNTTSNTCDRLQRSFDLDIVNIIDATRSHILNHGYRRVGLLGTRYVMEREFYRERLESAGIEVVTPESSDRAVIHNIIYRELCHGIFSQVSRDIFMGVVKHFALSGVEAVVLGCTEIPLILPNFNSHGGIAIIDSIDAHLDSALGASSHRPTIEDNHLELGTGRIFSGNSAARHRPDSAVQARR
ncbi:aspartate/glutamate racemase family protein [Burkholderia multivorans]|uniref:aspartate/glutamate racemase family protein n=1 Tax=Burkholderia multivorans TaxID=87883 RepID=UPI0009C167AD|nr:amino acid racemase [Burkholderia multivorans]MBU9560576.1 amino acid racemase [Burkholderia multivorans]